MADFIYNVAKKAILDGTLELASAGEDIRVLLLEENGADPTDKDDATVAAVLAHTNVTELSSTGYDRADGAIGTDDTTQDDTNDVAYYDGGNITFSGVSQDGSETVVAFLIFLFVTNDSDSIPIAFIDSATGLPLTPNGSDIQIQWAAAGILQLADPA